MNGHIWTPREIAVLRKMYPDAYAKDIAARLGMTVTMVYARAAKLGLAKSAAFYQRQARVDGDHLKRVGCAHRYPKGHVPANKGPRRPGFASGRMTEHWFKPGHYSKRWDPERYPVGALRLNADGYVDMKVREGLRAWKQFHRILWEDAHGPIQRGLCLVFKDRDPLNIELTNLQLITRAENMRRNSIHNLPAALKAAVLQLGRLKRRINRENRRGSAGSLVRDPARPA